MELGLREKVVACCRILYVEGHDDMHLGHVSAREPGGQKIFIKSRGPGLEEVTAEDILEIDLGGRKLSGEGEVPGEWPIHTLIYQARSDVNSVIHTHPFWGVVFGIMGLPFEVINQSGVIFYRGLRVFAGAPELITTEERGKGMIAALGDGNALLFPNHGVVIAGSSVEEALLLALSLEMAMKTQLLAAGCGLIRYSITPSQATEMGRDFLGNLKRTQGIFEYYVRKANRVLSSQQ